MSLALNIEDESIRATWHGDELFRYVYQPGEPQLESPRPYFHPLRTLDGDLVSLYRPHDHVWHKGIAWSLSNVGTENFWGGVTYLRDRGYAQIPNNGAMRHEGFERVEVRDGVLWLDERLTWLTEAGQRWIIESRRVAVRVLPDLQAWQLDFRSSMRNVSGAAIPFGSPTTEGRENAGYSGLFWRGPRSFSGGRVLTPDGEGGDELMGWRGPWMGFVGRHDEHGGASTLLFRDSPANVRYPTRWFVRAGVYACLCPAPFFDQEYSLPDGEELTLRYDLFVVNGALDLAGAQKIAGQATIDPEDPR
ncbi:PmoA family protein [Rugosimonospora acidiphila]|uniref:PmoA family protein n=1 Tax=Rugosimonospora acidiphila TaxID=556531 RepID=A0ABP9RMV0_9ACTN